MAAQDAGIKQRHLELFGSDSEDDDDEPQQPQEKSLKRTRADGDADGDGDDSDGDDDEKPKRMKPATASKADGKKKSLSTAAHALLNDLDSEDDEDPDENDEDRHFIDDADDDQRKEKYGDDGETSEEDDDDVRRAPQAEEAEEEEAGVERIFIKGGNKKKKKEKTAEEVKDMVIDLLTKMEMAADKDEKSNQEQKPCIAKLGLMNMVYEQLTKRKYQAEYLDHGVLGVLKEWLKPMPDGSLPNVLVRTKVLGILEALPINLELPDRKEQLRSSQLGELVMFLSKNNDETPDNRKRATQLVQRWARPIFELSTRYADMKATERVDLSASAAETAAAAGAGAVRRTGSGAAGTAGGGMQLGHGDIHDTSRENQPKPGEVGYRLHAAVPMPPKLDYSYEPTNNQNMEEKMRARGPTKGEMPRLQKTLNKSIRKRPSTRDAIAKMSVHGRNMHT